MTENNENDHDLLIRVHENVRNLIGEVKSLRDGTAQKINALENGKLDKEDFTSYKLDHAKELNEFKHYVEHSFLERSKEAQKHFDEIAERDRLRDTKIGRLEKIAYIAIGAFGLLQIILKQIGG